MVRNGYKQSQADHTMFVKHQGGNVTPLIMFVDDIVIIGDDPYEIRGL